MVRSARRFGAAAALLLALATVAGALGAHGLQGRLPAGLLEVYGTAVRYQFYNALGLLALGLMLERVPVRGLKVAGWLVLAGVVLFCGSLYALAFAAPDWIGLITPIGGLSLIAGWCAAALGLLAASRAAAREP